MAAPIVLEGDNLGKRHCHLNKLVYDAFRNNVHFDSIKNLPERSEVDCLFKIDVASKYRVVEYILENLQSDNMLYVSRALQSTWLITDSMYEYIVNPKHLHEKIYPTMQLSAVCKLKHAIYLTLKDERRCEVFYQYYAESEIEAALKYLHKCSAVFILNELKTKEIYLSPHLLKMLCEKSAHVAEYYFKHLIYEGPSTRAYLNDQENYLKSVKCLLKTNADIYLNILERLHLQRFDRLSERATHFVMKTQRGRFEAKPELYSAWILNLGVVARYLSDDGLKELIVKLARAEYLRGWFSYRTAEPLLKRLHSEEKSVFIKRIFVDKSFGSPVKEPPYKFPKAPENSYCEFRRPLKKRKWSGKVERRRTKKRIIKKVCRKSMMDKLYDMYRFSNFSKTFYELKKRIQGEPNHSNRQIMITVLITKSKSNEQYSKCLLEYILEKHLNEPITVKCSFARTMVKQAKAYKFSVETWNLLELVFHNIGVYSECQENISSCVEAIVIFSVLNQRPVPYAIIKKYLSSFSTLCDYSLNVNEKSKVFNYVFSLVYDKIETSLAENTTDMAIQYTWNIISLIEQWKKSLVNYENVLELIKRIVAADPEACGSLILNLYSKMKGHRKIFFKELFALTQNDESYRNALKHDTRLLIGGLDKFEAVLDSPGIFHHERFLRKIVIYFYFDLKTVYQKQIEAKVDTIKNEKVAKNVARALCVMKSPIIYDIIKNKSGSHLSDSRPREPAPSPLPPLLDQAIEKNVNFNEIVCKHLFLITPPIPVNTLIALSEVATIPLTTRLYQHPNEAFRLYVRDLLNGPEQFLKLVVRLAFKNLSYDEILHICNSVWARCKTNRMKLVLLKETHKCIFGQDENFNLNLWEFEKLIIENLNPKQTYLIYSMLSTIKSIPYHIKPDYCQTVYTFFVSVKDMIAKKLPSDIHQHEWRTEIVSYVNEEIGQFQAQFVQNIFQEFLTEKCVSEKVGKLDDSFFYDGFNEIILNLIPNYILSCQTLDEQTRRYDEIAKPFFEIIKSLNLKERKILAFDFVMKLNQCMNLTKIDATPVLKKIVIEMEEYLPFEENLDFYISIRMSIMYADAIKTVIHENMELISDTSMQEILHSKISYYLGKYIGLEVERVCNEYGLSANNVSDVYMRQHFEKQFYKYSWQSSQLSIVEGLISNRATTNVIIFTIDYLASVVHPIRPENATRFLRLLELMKEQDNREVTVHIYAKLTDCIAAI